MEHAERQQEDRYSALRQGKRESVQPHPADSVKNRLTSGMHQTCAAELLLEIETLVIMTVDKLQLLRYDTHTAGICIQIGSLDLFSYACDANTSYSPPIETPPLPLTTLSKGKDPFACFQDGKRHQKCCSTLCDIM